MHFEKNEVTTVRDHFFILSVFCNPQILKYSEIIQNRNTVIVVFMI